MAECEHPTGPEGGLEVEIRISSAPRRLLFPPFLNTNMFQPIASVPLMAGGRTPADGKRLGEQMSKKISGLFALLVFLALSLFLVNCGRFVSAGGLVIRAQPWREHVGSVAIDLGSGRLSLIQ